MTRSEIVARLKKVRQEVLILETSRLKKDKLRAYKELPSLLIEKKRLHMTLQQIDNETDYVLLNV